MRFERTRLWIAGLVAFVFGFPLSERAFAGGGIDIFWESIDLGLAIADSAGDS